MCWDPHGDLWLGWDIAHLPKPVFLLHLCSNNRDARAGLSNSAQILCPQRIRADKINCKFHAITQVKCLTQSKYSPLANHGLSAERCWVFVGATIEELEPSSCKASFKKELGHCAGLTGRFILHTPTFTCPVVVFLF